MLLVTLWDSQYKPVAPPTLGDEKHKRFKSSGSCVANEALANLGVGHLEFTRMKRVSWDIGQAK